MPPLRLTLAAVLGALIALVVAACGDDDPPAGAEVAVATLVDGLAGPTQLAWHPDGRLLVAVLGEGGEGATTGQVLALDLDDAVAPPQVLVDGLDTPTGLAVTADALWIMERTRLVTVALDDLGADAVPTVVRDELPSNGRSNGSLTVLADGRLLYDTSGRLAGDDAAAGSATLWALDPAAPDAPDLAVLTGMKHAYATAELSAGELLVTEIGDGRYDGDRAPDELLSLPWGPASSASLPFDGGWPRCIGDRTPVVEHGGTDAYCEATVPSLAVFDAGATPTGVAIAPWDAGVAVVALWVPGELVAVPLGGDRPAEVSVLLGGLDQPQDLLVAGDRLLVTLHTSGEIAAITSG